MTRTMPTHSRKGRRVRYGVVGLGHIAQKAVLPAFAHARNSTLTALVSGDGEKRRVLGERYGVARRFSYDDYAACLAEVDAVYLCTPNSEHAEQAIQAARAGVHVLCEKPLAVTDAECAAMLAARDAGRVKMMTAYRLHFEPLTLDVLGHCRAGRLGDLRYFSSAFSMRATPGNIRTRRETGGGSVYDLGIYCINAARMLFGAEPERVSAHTIAGARSAMPDVDETTAAVLHFAGDRLATFTSSFDAVDVSTYRIVGTDGEIVVDPAYEYAEPLAYTMTIGETTTRKRGRKLDQFAAELVYFSRCILDDQAPEPSAEEGAWDVRIIDALYESARRGETIGLRPFADPGPTADQATAVPPSRPPAPVHAEPPHD
jgi:predicted dehydrogenase